MDNLTYEEETRANRRAALDIAKALKARKLADDLMKAGSDPVQDIQVLSVSDLRARPRPEWMLEGLIQEGTIATLAGEAGLGKTFLALHLASCVATGSAFFSRYVKRGKVLYVIAEGAASFVNRIDALESYHHMSVPDDQIGFVESGVDLANPSSVKRLEDTLRSFAPDLIVLDTFSQLAGIDNENDAAQVAAIFRVARRLRELRPGSTVLMLHHVNKANGKIRGSSVIRGNSDTVLVARGDSDDFELTTEAKHDGKQKDGPAETLKGFRLVSHGPSAVITYSGVRRDPLWQAISKVVEDRAWHTAKELKAVSGVDFTVDSERRAYDRDVKRLVDAGSLIMRGTNRAREYQLPSVLAPRT